MSLFCLRGSLGAYERHFCAHSSGWPASGGELLAVICVGLTFAAPTEPLWYAGA